MAEATVNSVRREPERSSVELTATRSLAGWVPALSRGRVLLWLGFVIGTVAFLALGSIQIGAGDWFDQRLHVRDIWSRFLRYLVDQGATPGIIFVVSAGAVITLIGAAYALWLALAVKDQGAGLTSDDPHGP